MKTSCHCGAIEIEALVLPEQLIECNCSICRRYAALWGHLSRETTRVRFAPGAATAYSWNDRVIEFFHCNTCGCLTHYEGLGNSPAERVSINFRMFSPPDYEGLRVRRFDGAETWKFLD